MKTKVLVILVSVSALLSCVTGGFEIQQPNGVDISFDVLAEGTDSPSIRTQRKFLVLKTQEEFERELSVLSNEISVHQDFQNGVVLFASYGFAPQTRHSIQIVAIRDFGSYLEAEVVLKSPFDCPAGDAETYPYQFVYVAQRKTVVVKERMEDSC